MRLGTIDACLARRWWVQRLPFPTWPDPLHNEIVNATVTLDKAGRVVLPKDLRDELHLSPGDTLELTVEGDEVTLRPRRIAPPLQKECGVWVFRTGEPLANAEAREAMRKVRRQRARCNLGR